MTTAATDAQIARVASVRNAIQQRNLMQNERFVQALEALVDFYGRSDAPESEKVLLELVTRLAKAPRPALLFVGEMQERETRLGELRPLLAGAPLAILDLKRQLQQAKNELALQDADIEARAEGKNDRERKASVLKLRKDDEAYRTAQAACEDVERRLAEAEQQNLQNERQWTHALQVMQNRRALIQLMAGTV